MAREAVVDGALVGDKFVATKGELLPAKNVPKTPKFSPKDIH